MIKINNHNLVNIYFCIFAIILIALCICGFVFFNKGFGLYLLVVIALLDVYLILTLSYFEYEFDGNFIIIRKVNILQSKIKRFIKPSLVVPSNYFVNYSVIELQLTQVLLLNFKTSNRNIKAGFRLSALISNQKFFNPLISY
ncbi:Uncharacterised protein [Chryseobacterium nakagawai]|nr:Uncharacterised protein [Chryseobacterium nakagawai]